MTIDLFDVADLVEADHPAGVDPVLVGRTRFHQAVGGHDHTTGQVIELFLLHLPGAAVVADQVGECFQTRIGVGGEEFAVGVDLDSLAGGLFEDLVEIVQIVTRHDDERPFFVGDEGLGRLGVAVGGGIGGIQEFHALQIHLAEFHHQGQQVGQGKGGVEQGGQSLDEPGIDLGALKADHPSVVRIGGHAFHPEQEGILEGLDIRITFGRVGAEGLGLNQDMGIAGRKLVTGSRGEVPGGSLLSKTVLDLLGLAQKVIEAFGRKVDVGQGGE